MKCLRNNGTLIGAFAIFAPIAAAMGQDTTAAADTATVNRATHDSVQLGTSPDSVSGVQNPQGYRGMERPVHVFPPDSSGKPDRTAGQVEDKVTGTSEDSAWNDTTGVTQNPAGYRGMERPSGTENARADTSAVTNQKTQKSSEGTLDKKTADQKKAANKKSTEKKTATKADTTVSANDGKAAAAAGDSIQRDSTKWGTKTNRNPEVQNPPGYRGMERPVNVFPADSGKSRDTSAGAVEDRVTGTYEDSAWKDTTGAAQNPAGYRGMERPETLDSAANKGTTRSPADSGQQGEVPRSE